ncbi:class I SAM-dependent methyltransferase [Parachryseolinea silvisoli]|uniref:class I SAM-dependent methyltransferase n=1 Tax=Parachryseolinea silvisoli TaxID=2873601 RepID=UPI002265F935|nr:class I SAM-dependent methyltransferase [Parachryseolinea silvisoli]MCD9016704.1 class I SAM-dependent methyltransferase [Parachryseolinea silvisoli]
MAERISKRLMEIVDALPLKEGMRVLEIGCGPGAAAREICRRTKRSYVLAIDRSEKAIRQAMDGSTSELESGRIYFRHVAVEDFELDARDKRFDLAFAVRVGALDGRRPELEKQALGKIAKALKSNGRFFIDGGDPLQEISLDDFR